MTRRYTLSLHPKASLRKDLESWRAQPFTDEDFPVDLEGIIGAPATIVLVQNESGGDVYVNVAQVLPAHVSDGDAPEIPENYVRLKHREVTDGPGGSSSRARTSKQQAPDPEADGSANGTAEDRSWEPDDELPF